LKSQLNLNIYFSWSVHVLDQAYNPLWWPLAVNLQFWCCLQPIVLSDRTSSVSGRNAIRISIVSWLMALMSNECCFPRSITRLSIVLLIMTTKCDVMVLVLVLSNYHRNCELDNFCSVSMFGCQRPSVEFWFLFYHQDFASLESSFLLFLF
jgi:hypothetical protein